MTAISEKPILAVDIGGTKIAFATFAAGRLSNRRQIPTPRTGRGADLVAAIAREAGFRELDRIAVATTGIVRKGRLTALNPETLPIEDEFALADAIEQATGTRPIVVNDAQAAAWGEYRFGIGLGCANFAFVTVSTGIGAGIVANGQMVIGRNGLAGHLGHVVTDPNGEPCGCGRRGCLEAVASGSALARLGGASLGRTISTPELFDEAKSGNARAEAVLTAAAENIALAFGNLAATCDVDRIAVGGGVGLAEGFIERIRDAAGRLPQEFRRELYLPTAGADAGLLGVSDLADVDPF